MISRATITFTYWKNNTSYWGRKYWSYENIDFIEGFNINMQGIVWFVFATTVIRLIDISSLVVAVIWLWLIYTVGFIFRKMSISKCEYLYFFIFLVGYCETLSETYLYREVLLMRDRYKTSNISFVEQTRSKIQCGIQSTSVCQSFSYHKATSTCRGYDVIISDAVSSVLEGGWKTYNIDRTGMLI